MSDSDDSETIAANGYKRPPAATRFKPGSSGNPKGRPRGRRNGLPYDAVLGQLVTIREDGRERRITAAEAFLLHMTKSGLAGNGPAGRTALTAIEAARAARGVNGETGVYQFSWQCADLGYASLGLMALRMAVKLDRYRPTARMMLELWVVQAALARLGERKLTLDEQAEVYRATRTPWKVVWPEWWGPSLGMLRSPPPGVEPGVIDGHLKAESPRV